MGNKILRLIVIIFSICIATTGNTSENSNRLTSSDWPQFRGPLGAGRFEPTIALPSEVDPNRNLAWKKSVPVGHSSPIVVGNRIFLTGYEGQRLSTLCLESLHGEIVWRREIEVPVIEKCHPQHGPASCTPASDGQHVFVMFGSYGVICYDLDGNEVWTQRRETQVNMFGSAASPTVVDGRLIVFSGSETESLLQSIEPSTGQVFWERRQRRPASSWSTPVPMQTRGERAVLVYEPFTLKACSLKNGEVLWSVPGLADEPITLPQIRGGFVYTTSYNLRTNQEAIGLPTFEQLLQECDRNADGMISPDEAKANKSILSRPDADGQGDHPLRMFFRLLDVDRSGMISSEEWPRIHTWMESWKHANGLLAIDVSQDGEPILAWENAKGVSECPTPILVDDKICMVRNGGILTCIHASNGSLEHQERFGAVGPYYASPVFGDQKMYLASARGVVTILSFADAAPRVIAQADIGEMIHATPALSTHGLILRSEHHLWRFTSSP